MRGGDLIGHNFNNMSSKYNKMPKAAVSVRHRSDSVITQPIKYFNRSVLTQIN
jgi:hypothetical protein